MSIFDSFSRKASKAARTESGKNSAEIARVTREIADLGTRIEHLFTDFGRACFAEKTGEGDPAKTQEICQKIVDGNARVEVLKKELDTLNGVRRCPECGEVLPITARFCSACGVRQPDETAKPAEPAPAEEKPVEYCANCGAAREGEGETCAVCGKPFASEAPAEEATAEPVIDTEEPAADAIEAAEAEIEEAAEEAAGEAEAAVEDAAEAAEEIEEAAEDAVEEAAEDAEEKIEKAFQSTGDAIMDALDALNADDEPEDAE